MFSPRALIAAIGLLLPAMTFAGGVYTYTQSDGTVIYTNVPPPKSVNAKRLKGTFSRAPAPTEAARTRPAQVDTRDIDTFIDAAAARYRLPPALVRAVIHAESNFKPMALSHKGASGLMQLMPDTARDMYVRDIFDVRENIEGGARYLRVLANQFGGDMVQMVAAYNAGPDAVRRYGGQIPPFTETQAYVRKVIDLYFEYKRRSSAALAQRENR
ncbi:MAG: lytic transglycosylase domain-containing protein [Myxococcaceae bacterium]